VITKKVFFLGCAISQMVNWGLCLIVLVK
jgi:hypothetical protein